MRTPQWLADELEALNRRRMKGDITREDVVASAMESAEDKDPDLLAQIHAEWFGARADASLNRLKSEAVEAGRQLASTGKRQGSFEEICSDFFPRSTYGPLTPLEELWAYHEQQCVMTENFKNRDKDREARLRELDRAVNGDRTKPWEEAERRRLGLDGAVAADG